MNSAAISVLAAAGIPGREAEIQLRRLLSSLITPTGDARRTIEQLGLTARALDPSLNSIPEIIRRLADAGLDEPAARTIFGDASVAAILALLEGVEQL